MTYENERVLVLPRSIVLGDKSWRGFDLTLADTIINLVNSHKRFLPRDEVEHDPNFKQIIPYVVFNHENRFWVTQRTDKGGDERLHHKYSLGIGGHMREQDLTEGDIFQWAKREFEEEVDYGGRLEQEVIGVLNDDNDSVGQVHLGLVILAHGDSPKITVKEDKHKEGQLLSLGELERVYDRMETWSQFVFDYLKAK